MSYSGLIIFTVIPGYLGIMFAGNDINSTGRYALCKQTAVQKIDSTDIIINKYLDAIGGKEKWESVHSIYMEGTVLARGQKTDSKTWIVNNKCARTESTFSGFTSWNIIHTDSAWSYNPRRGQKFPEPWPSDRVKVAQSSLDIAGTLIDYKAKGYKAEYKGIEQIEGSDTYKIEETLNASVTKTYYIDMDSFLIIRVRTKTTTPNRVNYSNTDYSNYQKTPEGYLFPMEIGSTKYTVIKVNTDIDQSLFTPKK